LVEDIKMSERPPLGIMPRYIWNEKRLEDLRDAIYRYISAVRPVPAEWIEEYNELLQRTDRK
jgi:hypothetical protein